jgi:hypothetical protein
MSNKHSPIKDEIALFCHCLESFDNHIGLDTSVTAMMRDRRSACMLEEHAIACQPHDIDASIADRLQIGGKFYVAALKRFCARVVVSGVGAKNKLRQKNAGKKLTAR